MKLYRELENAIEEMVDSVDEGEEFRRRFKKLIYNYYERSYGTQDLEDTIELIKLSHEEETL